MGSVNSKQGQGYFSSSERNIVVQVKEKSKVVSPSLVFTTKEYRGLTKSWRHLAS